MRLRSSYDAASLKCLQPLGEGETTAMRRYISHHERLRTSSVKFAAACVKLGDRCSPGQAGMCTSRTQIGRRSDADRTQIGRNSDATQTPAASRYDALDRSCRALDVDCQRTLDRGVRTRCLFFMQAKAIHHTHPQDACKPAWIRESRVLLRCRRYHTDACTPHGCWVERCYLHIRGSSTVARNVGSDGRRGVASHRTTSNGWRFRSTWMWPNFF
jgi:hypothetical protein